MKKNCLYKSISSIFELFCKSSSIVLKVVYQILQLVTANFRVIRVYNLVILILSKINIDLEENKGKISLIKLEKVILVQFFFIKVYKLANKNIILLIDLVFKIQLLISS